ncbi:hypothetical protein ACIREE_24125 [Streptomyces sp. NPDC102467]|uniref:hypothetical protein n=1 Tax=Streptomyces sp. NPDC102467 TaxID=3366179 RepID=UPI003810F559
MVAGIKVSRAGVVLPVVLLAVLAAGCGTQDGRNSAADEYRRTHPTPTAISSPPTPAEHRCPGESPSPTPSAPAASDGATAQPGDHYAENHGFRVPFALHGKQRCAGLTAVGRVRQALEPLRERGDFEVRSTRDALDRLDFPDGSVESYENGDGVGFLVTVDDSPVCVEGTLSRVAVQANAFGGYPDHAGCDMPSGGH